MKPTRILAIVICLILPLIAFSDKGETEIMNENYNKLTPEEQRVILHKGTERPFSGDLLDNKDSGTYVCRQCDAPLYKSENKFSSGCGWPSFDDEIPGAVKKIPDADGVRTEIVCNNCNGHLGHVFTGEGFTPKNTRHCVNSISMKFVADADKAPLSKAYFAGGCFWGVEHLLQKIDGVKAVKSGYSGGNIESPSYEQVCSGVTGHYEAVEVEFDPQKTDFTQLAKAFFEIHNYSQENGQGPDIGPQYRSAIFYVDDKQKEQSQKLISYLESRGQKVATQLMPFKKFWPAESYHQDYYQKKGGSPYCHRHSPINWRD